jgi:hypothetical protein
VYTCIYAHIRFKEAERPTHTHTFACIYMYTYVYICIYIYIHTYIHAYIYVRLREAEQANKSLSQRVVSLEAIEKELRSHEQALKEEMLKAQVAYVLCVLNVYLCCSCLKRIFG